MKICIATTRGGLADQVSQVFGRCPTFTFVEVEDSDTKKVEVVTNEFANAAGGAGIQAAQVVVNKGANVVLAGNFGPNAFPILQQGKVEAIAVQGLVQEVLAKYLRGELSGVQQPTSPGHVVGGAAPNTGPGMGRGQGGGFGRGGRR